MIAAQTLVYSLTLWFGLYLIARRSTRRGLRFAGLGLIAYAVGLTYTGIDMLGLVTRFQWLPAFFWMVATLYLVPDPPERLINRGVLIAVLVLIAAFIFAPSVAALLPIAMMLFALIRVIVLARLRQRLVLITAGLFFTLGLAFLLLPAGIYVHGLVVLSLSVDLFLLGYALAVLDAFDDGTLVLRDLLRSFLTSALVVTLFGGQIAFVALITRQTSPVWTVLLYLVIASALLLVTFYDRWQSAVDRLILRRARDLRDQRAALRSLEAAALRVDPSPPFAALDPDDFARYTRQALSHLQNLPRLAESPLTRLPQIDARLAARRADDTLLERAAELKALLRECIERLRPAGEIAFTDEWRYYNALYFPYVLGIKPYSRKLRADDPDPLEQAAIDWFLAAVPERTLYNWQTAAAKLIARELEAP
ncbi:MAG: hypothetical protein IAE80_24980 [Anaerolinea sp.]|nr:hypothetical protein [Anaerolinea sp.]